MAISKVVYNNNTLIDITDTTATASDVVAGQVFYMADGTRSVGTLNVTDYVTSKGTSGNWSYRKWHSGRIEAEGYATFTKPSFTASGNMYRSSALSFSIPSGIFTSTPSEAHGWIRSTSATVYFATVIGTSSATAGTCQIFKSTSGNATADISVHMRLVQL